jgi:alpha-L-rhamnosidase
MNTSRRQFLALATAALGGAHVVGAQDSTPSTLFQIDSLMVDGLVTPLGLESLHPRLSWNLTSTRRGFKQRQFRILVATDPTMLMRGQGDLWDSGLKDGDTTFDVSYEGVRLASRQRSWWRVEAFDAHRVRVVSPVSWWEMGLLENSDWQAQWIAAETARQCGDRAAGLHWIWNPNAQNAEDPQAFRFVFNVDEIPSNATLLIVARDEIEGVWINGAPAPRQPFKSGVVNNARMESIPLQLRRGSNVLSVQAALRPKGWPKTPAGALAALLRLEYASGQVQRLTTPSGWLTRSSPVEGWQLLESDDDFTPAVEALSKPPFDPWPAEPAVYLRCSFSIAGQIRHARLYITALGAYEARLNGERVGDEYLSPESTDFGERALYRTFDVTHMLKPGENALGAIVGDGWYGSTGLFVGRYAFGPAPNRLLAQLEVQLADGRRIICATSSDWRGSASPIRASEIYDGEIFDARAEIPGWDQAAFKDEAWSTAAIAPRPPARLVSQVSPPVRIVATLLPKAILRQGEVYTVDFGQNVAGSCLLRAKAAAGTTVTLRFAEIVKSDGTIDTSNLRSAAARDIFTFRGEPEAETFRPHFTYHGFRYVEISGWTGELPENFIVGEVISSDLPITGTLRIDDALIEQIWRNALWSQRSNFIGIPTDCPQRDERLGWMGDAQVFWDAAGFNMDVAAFTRRFTGDVRDAQAPDGAFAEFNPQPAVAQMKGAPGWADAGVLLPWSVWWRYGDTEIIDENWDAMAHYAEHVAKSNPDYIWRNERGSDYGDWLALDAKEPGDPTTPKDLVATAMWAVVTSKLSQLAAASHRHAEAAQYAARHQRIASAFAKNFVNADGIVGNGSQTGYVLALQFGLLPMALRGAARRALCQDIRRRGTIISTGFLGTPHVLDVLADAGEVDLVYALLDRTDYPSWGYMVRHGATTMWERWNSDTGDVAMNSYNHYAFGAIVGFLYRRIAGIDAIAPGFRRARIHPLATGRLKQAGASYVSRCGTFTTQWCRDDNGSFDLAVSVPANTSAEIHLPKLQRGTYHEGRASIQHNKDVRILSHGRTGTVLEVGSGEYSFRAR